MNLTISTNHWKVPNVKTAFSGWLEGAPSESEKRKVIAQTLVARQSWVPNKEAWELVTNLKANFVGSQVMIQDWSPSMFYDEDDGPYPISGFCKDVVIKLEEGFEQAFLIIFNPMIIKEDGPEPLEFECDEGDKEGNYLSPLSRLYQISII